MTCIVHTFWDGWMSFWPEGEAPWNGHSPHFVIGRLRADLAKLAPDVKEPEKFGTHDFRGANDSLFAVTNFPSALNGGLKQSSCFNA